MSTVQHEPRMDMHSTSANERWRGRVRLRPSHIPGVGECTNLTNGMTGFVAQYSEPLVLVRREVIASVSEEDLEPFLVNISA